MSASLVHWNKLLLDIQLCIYQQGTADSSFMLSDLSSVCHMVHSPLWWWLNISSLWGGGCLFVCSFFLSLGRLTSPRSYLLSHTVNSHCTQCMAWYVYFITGWIQSGVCDLSHGFIWIKRYYFLHVFVWWFSADNFIRLYFMWVLKVFLLQIYHLSHLQSKTGNMFNIHSL